MVAPGFAQGSTTGAIGGLVTDAEGRPLEGVQVRVVDRASGYAVAGVTRANGRYVIPGLDVNGDYTVSLRRVGLTPFERANVRVTLTQTVQVNATLKDASVELQAITVTAGAESDFTATRQGTKTVVSDTVLRRLPTLNRNLYDFVKLTPQVSVRATDGRTSVAGQNNRLNNIQVDGASVVNRFGLGDSQELGAQAGGRSMTMEAVKEYQVLISPFDVRQGNFTGGAVNAVTRAGSNDVSGSAFFFNRNEGMSQDDPFTRDAQFSRLMYGASLGGPIVKDKAHFFVAAEFSSDQRGASGPYVGQPGNATSTVPVTVAQIDSFANILRGYGIEAGTGGLLTNQNPIANTFARLDVQLGERHRLVLRNIYNESSLDAFSRQATGTNRVFALTGHNFTRTEQANSLAAQGFSTLGNGALNEFTVGYTTTRFKRDPAVLAPMITVQNVGGANNAQLRAGTENSSQGNFLNENLLEISNNFTRPLGDRHTLTLGTRNEFYEVENGFLQNSYGNYTFASLAALAAGTPSLYSGSGSLGGDPVARFTAGQFAVYGQDEFRVTDRLAVTAGLRLDLPYFFDKPGYSALVEDALGRRTDVMPEGNVQFSPRVGFNYDLTGTAARMQVRGGLGMFQGQPAFVWMSNQFSNSGVALGQLTCGPASTNGSAPTFDPNPVAPTTCGPLAGFTGANAARNGEPGVTLSADRFPGTINLVGEDLKYPQVLRGTLAIDRELPGDVVATIEGLYTKGLNNFVYENINRVAQSETDANGRVLFGTFNATGQATYARVDPRLDAVLEAKNQSEDYSYSLTGQLRKRFTDFWEGTAAYTYGRSYSVSDLTSSVAFSNWQFGRMLAGGQDSRRTAPSAFDQPHRILLAGTVTAPWKSTDVSFIYQAASGTPFAFSYTGSSGRGDLNADGSSANDPIYIPTDATSATQIQFATATFSGVTYTAEQQAEAFERFIETNDCLRSQRGRIMTNGSCRNPWTSTIDMTIRQTFPEFDNGRLSVQLDIYNVANFIRRDWGKIRTATGNTNLAVLTHSTSNANGPVFNFNPTLVNPRTLFTAVPSAAQFFQMQLSLRYAF